YYDHHFPINPRNYSEILDRGGEPLANWAALFRAASASKGRRENRVEEAREECRKALQEQPSLLGDVERALQEYDAATPRGRVHLHRLIEKQHYRLAWWRTASDEINWRRFFDVVELAGVRVQELSAFSIVHATTFYLYSEGLIDGVRIDHIDGLADPRTYCRRLRQALSKLNHKRPPDAPSGR